MLKFGENVIEKCKCHSSKSPIDINNFDIDNILVSH